MNSIEEVDVLETLKYNYSIFGAYANSSRGCVGFDGLKSGARRLLLSLRDLDQGKEIATSKVLAHCLETRHPHSLDAQADVLAGLVQRGFVIPLGNFGNSDAYITSPPAAYRYTAVKNHKEFSDGVFKFSHLIDTIENEFGLEEPKFLSTPIPLALCTSAFGIGFGISSNYPFFSAKSLLAALQADDPNLLKAPNGLTLTSSDGITDIWTKGVGSLEYAFRCYAQESEFDGKRVSFIEGPGRYFAMKPLIDNVFEELETEGSVYIRDESKARARIAISRVKNIKKVTDTDVHNLALMASTNRMYFRIYVNNDNITKKISMQNWMQNLWNSYDNVVNKYKIEQKITIENKIKILNYIPKVYPLLVKGTVSEEISSKLKLDIGLVKDIESRPLRILRKTDFDSDINRLNEEIVSLSKLSAKTLAADVVNTLEKAQLN